MRPTLLAAAALLAAAPLQAGTIAIVGGTVAVGDGSQPVENGVVIIRDELIVAAGRGVAIPPGAAVIDARGKWVSAGVMAGWSTLGLAGESYNESENDASAAKSPFSAAIDVSTAINPNDMTVSVDRAGGVTRAIVAPVAAKTIFGGQGSVIDLGQGTSTLTKARAFQFVELGEEGARLAGGSRPAAYALLRAALREASGGERSARGAGDPGDGLTAADIEALMPVIQGVQRLVVHVERASDIKQVLGLRKEFPKLRLVLLGASEGWMVAPQIAAAQVPVISNAIENLPERFEMLAASPSNVGRMVAAGVTVALSAEDYGPLYRNMRQLAANLVATSHVPGETGLSWAQAFASISSKPAEVLGLDGEIGSLRSGRHADVIIWDGDPLEAESAPVAMFIDGKKQLLSNHLTELRDRYANPVASELPKAYER
jgi:imidazolonepropionase-like amidohydrolase